MTVLQPNVGHTGRGSSFEERAVTPAKRWLVNETLRWGSGGGSDSSVPAARTRRRRQATSALHTRRTVCSSCDSIRKPEAVRPEAFRRERKAASGRRISPELRQELFGGSSMEAQNIIPDRMYTGSRVE